MARKKKSETEYFDLDQIKDEVVEVVMDKPLVSPASLPKANIAEPEDSNRKIKMEIIDQIEKINNRYYLLIVKKYIDNLGV